MEPFVKRQKNDGADAEAICEASQRPTIVRSSENKTNFMPEAEKLSASMMRRGTDFHRNSTRRLHRKELKDASPTQSLTEDDRASRVRSVYLKYLLGRIRTDRANLDHGRLRSGGLNISAVAGASTPSPLGGLYFSERSIAPAV